MCLLTVIMDLLTVIIGLSVIMLLSVIIGLSVIMGFKSLIYYIKL